MIGLEGNGSKSQVQSLTDYRLGELERKMDKVEKELTKSGEILTRIDEKINNLASEKLLWKVFGGTLCAAVVTIAIHVALKMMAK